jgi:hypothetical protein
MAIVGGAINFHRFKETLMPLRISRYLKLGRDSTRLLVALATAGTLVGTACTLTGTATLQLGVSTACGCSITGVTANPDIYDFPGTTKVGGAAPKQTIVYTNHGPGNWTFTGAKFNYLNSEKQPGFTYKQGTTACNAGPIANGATCELIVEFTPAAAEPYDAYFEAEPGAENVIVTGRGG